MIDRDTFCKVYLPMAKEGATALEIANALGVDKPTDKEKSGYVTAKASIYRRALKERAEAKAAKKGLSEDETKALVKETVAKIPKLSKRTRDTEDFVDFLDSLIAECDAEPDEAATDEAATDEAATDEDSTEAPE